jgi:hypothetical protein
MEQGGHILMQLDHGQPGICIGADVVNFATNVGVQT